MAVATTPAQAQEPHVIGEASERVYTVCLERQHFEDIARVTAERGQRYFNMYYQDLEQAGNCAHVQAELRPESVAFTFDVAADTYRVVAATAMNTGEEVWFATLDPVLAAGSEPDSVPH